MVSHTVPVERPSAHRSSRRTVSLLIATAAVLALGGLLWVIFVRDHSQAGEQPTIPATSTTELTGPTVATMDSPVFRFGPGWEITSEGADPGEPANPWDEPAGVLEFPYRGSELALQLADGNFWGYLFVTVDGSPANLLPTIDGNTDSLGQVAGYKTLYAPEVQSGSQPTPHWVRVHRSHVGGEPHMARVEIWRSWDQRPLRAVAIDALPRPAMAVWPGVVMLVAAVWIGYLAWCARQRGNLFHPSIIAGLQSVLTPLSLPYMPAAIRLTLASITLLFIAIAIAQSWWLLCLVGILLLAYLAWARPAIWTAALVFALPFYYSYTLPLLPNRSFGIIDVGILAGLLIVVANRLFLIPEHVRPPMGPQPGGSRLNWQRGVFWLLAAIVSWSLISTYAADRFDVAVHEWRTVFLYAGLFALILNGSLRRSDSFQADQWLILVSWLAGGTFVAAFGIWQYLSDTRLITAEGVYRIRAFYGSPNNLALYLERTVIVSLGLALFSTGRVRLAWMVVAIIQILALVLTFSKGSLLLGLPAALVVLWLGGMVMLGRDGRPRHLLWWIVAIALLSLLLLTPFLTTERFQGVLNFSTGTGFLRLQLWRSAWQMALDHPLFGVGPDNFLYEYRSNYLLPQAWQEPNLNHPHNWPLDWWTRLGLPALGMAIAFYAVGMAHLGFRLWRAHRFTAWQNAVSIGLLAASVAALIHGLIDASYSLPDLMIVWVLMLGIQLHHREHSNNANQRGDGYHGAS